MCSNSPLSNFLRSEFAFIIPSNMLTSLSACRTLVGAGRIVVLFSIVGRHKISMITYSQMIKKGTERIADMVATKTTVMALLLGSRK